jgi:hypothetical protein
MSTLGKDTSSFTNEASMPWQSLRKSNLSMHMMFAYQRAYVIADFAPYVTGRYSFSRFRCHGVLLAMLLVSDVTASSWLCWSFPMSRRPLGYAGRFRCHGVLLAMLLDVQLLDADSVQQLHVQQSSTYAKPGGASAVLGSWWWAVCRPKHVELHINTK